ncbi:MAG: hypothetical protein JOZ43_03085 [Acidobacteriales bacterium]|nr:hypothetical protein [Terriglobales bacterium]
MPLHSHSDDLHGTLDDMNAFIFGHGLKQFRGYVEGEVPSVLWEESGNPESWKDFVELAQASGAHFVTVHDEVLMREDLDYLVEQLRTSNYPNEEDLDEARWLRAHVGKTGFVQLGFPQQGTMFLFELSTEWYDRYQHLLELAEDIGGIMMGDESDQH